ncbi:filamentous hemagglutinin N-terminal domain-containing protein [Providencia manganoxydans]|uniref:Filamentous hemagglutinin N-terminal domain-containing protein n=1 Tax=Providencia manganoxydans TaxID=2923283 RepID=A0ABX7AI49_9GAMM|nr:filamentous hemagglutinin N-terminal domain-containing protein [Providencia manganoxydans]MDX4944847.1 filamentous hemagglutinin N-terminal domain-containing protein [Providencia manganoxydans]QQO63437.1 filamentous hemagglutinin N-terminal domain-containing protein [Providencia manganoxydans]HEF8772430.1 filamentous hemagglutinin N-terminal domain-containing protein [Providencia stuartii]
MKYTFNFIYLLTLVLIGNSAVATISPDINQVKVINIVEPLDNHISFNSFETLSSNEHGLIFNNDINDNQALGGKAAKLILAEVTGNEATNLKGVLGIKGQIANLVIANPNGITWNNGSVSNISSLSLVAGNFERQFIKDKTDPSKLIPKPLKDYTQLKFSVSPNSQVTINHTQATPIQLAKINIFADRIKLQNAVNITSAVQNYLSSSGHASLSINEGALRSGSKFKSTAMHSHGSHFELGENAKLMGRSILLESHQYQCKDSFMCPQNKIDIKGLIEAMNFSLQGDSQLSVTGRIRLGSNQQTLVGQNMTD